MAPGANISNLSQSRFRVAFDLRAMEEGFKAHYGRGTGRYATELFEQLKTLAPNSSIALSSIQSEQLKPRFWEQMLIDAAPLGKSTLSTQLVLPRALKRLNADLVHFCAHGDAPSRSSVPYVVTVLDLIPLKLADMYKADNPNWRYHLARALELRALKGALGILAISENTKRDIVEILGVNPERIVVTPLGVDSRFVARPVDIQGMSAAKSESRAMFELPPIDTKILLYVGGIDPRKNINFLLELFSRVQKLSAQEDTQKPLLVLAGRYDKDKHFPDLKKRIRELDLDASVRLLGFVPDQKLSNLYHTADLVMFPSLYEGFGLPVLEAMACGVPVIAGKNSCMPEVVGEHGLLVEDGDLQAWAFETVSVMNSENRQSELAQHGVQRASQFTWKRTAELTLTAYEGFIPRKRLLPFSTNALEMNA